MCSSDLAAHSVSPTFAQLNSCMVAPPGKADRIACEEHSALGLELVELVVALLLGVSLEFDEEDPQAEKARTSPRTGTTVRFRRTRPMRALWLRRDRAVVDDKGVLPNGSWCACGSTMYPLKSPLKRKLLGQRFQPTGPQARACHSDCQPACVEDCSIAAHSALSARR